MPLRIFFEPTHTEYTPTLHPPPPTIVTPTRVHKTFYIPVWTQVSLSLVYTPHSTNVIARVCVCGSVWAHTATVHNDGSQALSSTTQPSPCGQITLARTFGLTADPDEAPNASA